MKAGPTTVFFVSVAWALVGLVGLGTSLGEVYPALIGFSWLLSYAAIFITASYEE